MVLHDAGRKHDRDAIDATGPSLPNPPLPMRLRAVSHTEARDAGRSSGEAMLVTDPPCRVSKLPNWIDQDAVV